MRDQLDRIKAGDFPGNRGPTRKHNSQGILRGMKKAKPVSVVAAASNHGFIGRFQLRTNPMAKTLRLPYSVQGNGTVESIGNHMYRVCGPAGCTVVMGLSNALNLSRNVPDMEQHNHSHR